MKRLALATCAASGLLLLAGCGHAQTRGADQVDPATSDSTADGPTNVRWKAVLNDWFNDGINHEHSCAAVKAAISHLPTNTVGYSTVNEDLAAYERKVC
jgi:hypothetical protein